MQPDVLGAFGPHLEDRGRLRGERAVERGAERLGIRGTFEAEPVERGGVREVEAVRGRDVALEVGALALDREDV